MTAPFDVILDPPEVAVGRTALHLNENAIRIDQAGLDWGDATIQAYMADLTVGSMVVDYRLPNRMVQIPLGLGMDDSGQAGFDDARLALQQKVALLQGEGGWLKRQDGLYADVVNATLTEPDQWGETGAVEPNVKLVLECLPDFYGDEITLDTLSGTGEISAVLLEGAETAVIDGDLPGRATVTVTDTSAHDQHGLVWGFRARNYDGATTAALAYEAEALGPSGGSSVVALAGASGGHAVEHPALTGNWTDVLSTDLGGVNPLTHVGSYRVRARVWATQPPAVRFIWNVGGLASPVINTQVQVPTPNQFVIVDLGPVRLDPLAIGNHAWKGKIQAMGSGALYVDKVWFQPLGETPGAITAYQAVLDPGQAAPAVIYSSKSMEVAYNGAFGLGADGLSWANLPNVIGDLPRIPPSGLEARPVQILVKTTRGDLGALADAGIDGLSVQVKYRPSFLFRN